MKKVDVDNFLLENNHVLWGEEEKHSAARSAAPFHGLWTEQVPTAAAGGVGRRGGSCPAR